eukprot:scaffold17847_cov119-Isochrysis_galbana.AAC.2
MRSRAGRRRWSSSRESLAGPSARRCHRPGPDTLAPLTQALPASRAGAFAPTKRGAADSCRTRAAPTLRSHARGVGWSSWGTPPL